MDRGPLPQICIGSVGPGSSGLYDVSVTVSDGQASTSLMFSWFITGQTSADRVRVNQVVSRVDDDAEESGSGKVVLDFRDLELAEILGLRFAPLNVPAGATILNASLQFTVAEATSRTTTLEIRGQSVAHASPFSTRDNDLSTRVTSDAFVQ